VPVNLREVLGSARLAAALPAIRVLVRGTRRAEYKISASADGIHTDFAVALAAMRAVAVIVLSHNNLLAMVKR